MKTKSTHVIVLIVSVLMLFGSMGIAVFATDEAASDNNAAVTEQITQDEVQPDAVVEETAPAKAKGASLGDMKAAESSETATEPSICVIKFDAGNGAQYSAFLNDAVKLADLMRVVGITNSTIKKNKTKVDHTALLSVTEENSNYYIRAIGNWAKDTKETIYLRNSNEKTVATIAVTATFVSDTEGKDIVPPEEAENLVYDGSEQVLITAGSTTVGKMQYAKKDGDQYWSDSVASIKGKDAMSYTVYWRAVCGNNNLAIMSGQVTANIDPADPEYTPPKAMKPAPVYKGTKQQIATKGSTTAGTVMKYYVGDNPPEDEIEWCTSLTDGDCMQTEADKYKVWYKVDSNDDNYNKVEPDYIVAKIKKQEVKLTWGSTTTFVYNKSEQAPSAEAVDVSNIKVIVKGAVNAGKHTAKATGLTGDNAKNYKLPTDGSEKCKFTIKPAKVDISWAGETEFVYNGDPKSPEARIADPVTNYIYQGDECEVKGYKYTAKDGSKLTGKYAIKVGKYTAAVATFTNSNYEIADNAPTRDFEIKAAKLTGVSVNLDGWTYGDSAKKPSLVLPEGVSMKDLDVEYTYQDLDKSWKSYKKGSYPKEVGTYTICAHITSDNYIGTDAYSSFIISQKNAKVKAPTAKKNLAYNGADQELIKAGSVEGGTMMYAVSDVDPNKEDANVEFKPTIPVGKEAKAYKVWYKYSIEDSNYTTETPGPVIGGPVTATIEPKTVSLSWDKKSLTQEYTGKALSPSASVELSDGRVEFDTIKVVFKFDRDGEVDKNDVVDAGEYTTYAYLRDKDDQPCTNYAIKERDKTKTFTIEPVEVDVSVKVDGKVYNGEPVATTGLVSYIWNGKSSVSPPEGEEVSVSVTFYKDLLHLLKTTKGDGITGANGSAPKNEGTYYVETKTTPEKTSGNYEYKSAKDLKFTISPKEVKVDKWSLKSFVYDGKEHAPKAEVTGCIGDEDLTAVVFGAEKDAGEYTATVKKLEAADDDTLARNYALPKDSSVSTGFTIAPRLVTVTWGNNDGCKDAHIVDGSKHKVKATIVGAVNGEVLLPKYAPNSVIEAKAAGTYKGIVNGVLIKKLIIFKTETHNYKLADASGISAYAWMVSNPDDDPVADVIALIKELDPNAADYAAKAWIVVDAFNALSKDQKADSRFREQEVATKLAGAQYEVAEEADQKAAKPVMEKIDALTANSTKADVEAARAAYNALSYAQKAACGQSRSFTLQSQEYRIYSGEAKVKKVNGYKVKNVKGKKARATWKQTAGVDGYKITYKAKGVKTKTVYANASATKKTLTKLKKNKKYTVKIRSFNVVYNPLSGKDEKVFGKTSTKKVKIKK